MVHCFQTFYYKKKTLQCLDIEHLKVSPPMCSWSSSSLNYSPAGHLMNGDVSKVNNDNHESLIHKFQNLRKPNLLTGIIILEILRIV